MEIIINQILILAILITFGFVLFKMGFIDDNLSNGLSKLLLKFIVPLTIVQSFNKAFDFNELKEIFFIALLSIIVIFISIFISKFLFKENEVIEQYASIFTNKSFIGIPLVSAIYGESAVAYITPMIFVGHLFIWTYGQDLLSDKKRKIDLKRILINPSSIGLFVGLLLFVSPIVLSGSFASSIKLLTNINTPLAMLVVGGYLANDSIIKILLNKKAYLVSFNRLIINPIVLMFLLKFTNFDDVIKVVFVIANALPSAANTAMAAQIENQDYTYAAQVVSQGTIISAFTIPFILWLTNIIL